MSELQKAIDHVAKRLNEGPPKMWDFDKDGEQIIGVIVGIEKGMTKKYGAKPILLISVKRGDIEEVRSVWVLHTALASKLKEKNPFIGDVIGIQRGEMKEGQNGEYRSYDVQTFGSQTSQRRSFVEVSNAAGELEPGPMYEDPPVDAEIVDEPRSNSWA